MFFFYKPIWHLHHTICYSKLPETFDSCKMTNLTFYPIQGQKGYSYTKRANFFRFKNMKHYSYSWLVNSFILHQTDLKVINMPICHWCQKCWRQKLIILKSRENKEKLKFMAFWHMKWNFKYITLVKSNPELYLKMSIWHFHHEILILCHIILL
jgi:hypothetical protein